MSEAKKMLSLSPSSPIPFIKKRRLSASAKPSSTEQSSIVQEWIPLHLSQSELSLPLTFPTGQTFRWKRTAPLRYTGVVGPHLFSLVHRDGGVFYQVHSTSPTAAAESALLDFLNAGVSLTEIWLEFSRSDARFSELACHFAGARVLRQDPHECLFQFLCSSNNNIARITKMVDYLSSLGEPLGVVGGMEFHQFPSVHRLASISDQQLREAGFGYRAKYITGTAKTLMSKPHNWLKSLRESELNVAIDSLCTLPGVGPKVASCVALFSLDQHHAVPVDTHVWKIATKHLLPELQGVRFSPKHHRQVADAFVKKYGTYAGWAQTLLFIAELPPQKALLQNRSNKN